MQNNKLISGTDLFVISFISAIWIVLFNLDSLLIWISGNDQTALSNFYNTLGSYINSILEPIQERFLRADIVTFGLWFLLGIICYVIIGIIVNKSREVGDKIDLNSASYVHSRSWNATAYKKSIASEIMLTFAFTLTFIFWLILSIKYFIPSSSSNVLVFMFGNDSLFSRTFSLLLAFISIFLMFIGALIIIRISRQLLKK